MADFWKSIFIAGLASFILSGCQISPNEVNVKEKDAGSVKEIVTPSLQEHAEAKDYTEDDQNKDNERDTEKQQFLEYYLKASRGAYEAVNAHTIMVKDEIDAYKQSRAVDEDARRKYQESIDEVHKWNEELNEYDGVVPLEYEEQYKFITEELIKDWNSYVLTLGEYEGFLDSFKEDDVILSVYGNLFHQQSLYARNYSFFLEENGYETDQVIHLGPTYLTEQASYEEAIAAAKETMNFMLPLFEVQQDNIQSLEAAYKTASEKSLRKESLLVSDILPVVSQGQRCIITSGIIRSYSGNVASTHIESYNWMTGDVLDKLTAACDLPVIHIRNQSMMGKESSEREMLQMLADQSNAIEEIVSLLKERKNELSDS